MFRIHKVFDVTTPTNRQILSQVQAMLRVQFNDLSEKDIARLPTQLAASLGNSAFQSRWYRKARTRPRPWASMIT